MSKLFNDPHTPAALAARGRLLAALDEVYSDMHLMFDVPAATL